MYWFQMFVKNVQNISQLVLQLLMEQHVEWDSTKQQEETIHRQFVLHVYLHSHTVQIKLKEECVNMVTLEK